jgi:hypothetical protein
MINPGAPKKADLNKAIAAYVDVAEASSDASIIEGLAAKRGFEYDYRGGYFVIAAKASRCFGLGGEANVAGKVGVKQIGQFFMCVAHQLKQADYRKLSEVMRERAFHTMNKIFFLLSLTDKRIESFVGTELAEIDVLFESSKASASQLGADAIKGIERRLNSGWGWHAYMPPESRGAVIRTIIDVASAPSNVGNEQLRQSAALAINELLVTVQTARHLYNTLDRITTEIGHQIARSLGTQLIHSVVAGTLFADCVGRCESELMRSSPLVGRPFLRNDDDTFLAAQLPLQHPAYYG